MLWRCGAAVLVEKRSRGLLRSNLLLARRALRSRQGGSDAAAHFHTTGNETVTGTITTTTASVPVSLPDASTRPPPTYMPLYYIKEGIPHVEEYKTDHKTWSMETIGEAWEAFHQSLQTYTSQGEVIKVQEMVDRDLAGLALCTSHAEVKHLLSTLSPSLRSTVAEHPFFAHAEVEEIFMHLGQEMEIRGGKWVAQFPPPSVEDLQFTMEKVGRFGDDGRGCIPYTPHRVSIWRGRSGEPLGLTIRVGRFVPNVAKAILPLAKRGSVLIISKAGIGKTTLLRDLASSLAREGSKPRVMVVDTSNEIGGDCPIPLPFLGRCRRIQVPRREEQERVMTQVLQNHSPEYVIVDEIASTLEAQAAWSISQRGVHLVATCHGESLAGLLQNQSLNLLVGGAAHAFLSNEERRLRNKVKKTILERPHSSPFRFVVELESRNSAHIYVDVNAAVDLILDEQDARRDASVGRHVELNQPLSDELIGLITLKEKQGIRQALNDTKRDVLINEIMDSDGYRVTRGRPGSERNRSRHGKNEQRKTDEELLGDLEGFL